MTTTTTIEDVRKTLWEAYQRLAQTPEGIFGKSDEACCEVLYPSFFDFQTLEEFMKPSGLMVYSYALGPSRKHFFYRSDKESHPDYTVWYSPDPFAKAIKVINGWLEKALKEQEGWEE